MKLEDFFDTTTPNENFAKDFAKVLDTNETLFAGSAFIQNHINAVKVLAKEKVDNYDQLLSNGDFDEYADEIFCVAFYEELDKLDERYEVSENWDNEAEDGMVTYIISPAAE